MPIPFDAERLSTEDAQGLSSLHSIWDVRLQEDLFPLDVLTLAPATMGKLVPMSRTALTEYLVYFERYGNDVAVAERRGYRWARVRYRELLHWAQQFARELEVRGIVRGDRVLLWGENSAAWVAAFWGCLLRGAVVVPMDRIAAPDFARRVAEQVDARLVVCARALGPHIANRPNLSLEDLPEIIRQHSAVVLSTPELRRQDPVQIVFTSGTTAEPRGVVLTHGNILANLEPLEGQIRSYLKYERIVHPIRFLTLLPLSHVFGQFLGLFLPPLLGSTVTFAPALNPAEIIETIRQQRISVLVTVPHLLKTLQQKLLRDLEAEGRLDPFWQQYHAAAEERFWWRWWRFRRIHRRFGWKFWAFVSGGATLDAATEEFWTRLGYAVIQGYGLTETTSLISVNHPFRLSKGSIGKTLPGREIKLSENGEILVRGESVAAGYWTGQQLQPVLGEDGWFHTGDLGALDAEGNLYFKGRRKNVIVTPAGLNVYPEDLEAVLRRQPEVRDAVVIGIERAGNAEPCAVLLLRDAADPEGVVRRANAELADFQQIRHWHVWPEEDFPRTPTQKPRLGEIQQAVAAALGDRTGVQPTSGALAELIARVTGRAPKELNPNAQLGADLDLSSIDRVELLSAIEDRFQVDLSEARFTEALTVGEVEQMLHQPAPPRAEFVYPRWAQRWPVTWLRLLVYYLLVWPATMVLARPAIRGREHLRGLGGPLLVVSNHITRSDIGFILAALPARLRHRLAVAMEGERLRDMRTPPPSRGVLRGWLDRISYVLVVALFNVFPLPTRAGFRQSFRYAGECVDRGYSLLVFPEGRLTRDGSIGPFRTGIGILAANLRLPVLPMRIDGLFALKQRRQRWARPGTVRVTIGRVLHFALESDPEEITRTLEAAVKSLGS